MEVSIPEEKLGCSLVMAKDHTISSIEETKK